MVRVPAWLHPKHNSMDSRAPAPTALAEDLEAQIVWEHEVSITRLVHGSESLHAKVSADGTMIKVLGTWRST